MQNGDWTLPHPGEYADARKVERKTNMQRLKLIFTALAALGLIAAGCSKKEPETTPPPSTSANVEKTEPLSPTHPAPTPSSEPETTTPSSPTPTPAPVLPPSTPPAAQEETPAQLAAQVQQLESTYHNTPDFQKRVALIYDLSSVESPATIDALGHLLVNEPDQELKVELINSLSDIDGENDKKLAILTGALRPDQPKDVRLEAIDAIVETEDKRGIQVLQGLLHDPDEDIRDSVQDGIEQLQATVTNPQ
jgi:type IV secretory pathway VirB10-like protein